MGTQYRMCARCVMDTTDPEIVFDSRGFCNHCSEAIKRMEIQLLPTKERELALEKLVEDIRKRGKGLDYDCIIGVSGGVDSSTVAYYTKKLGLRPLAIHLDNGWNSELAVDNIGRLLQAFDIDLDTHVIDWEEFRDLQLAFLRSSLENLEIPTDHAIMACLFKAAVREKVRYILLGSNLVTEVILPYAWAHPAQDLRLLKAVHQRYGSVPLKTYPTISITEYLDYVFVKGIRQVPFLNLVDYDKEKAKELLHAEVGWRDYGGKHFESVWTRFFQGYYLPTKHGFDKRRAHLSSLICAGQLTREQALDELAKPAYEEELAREDMQFVIKKFGITQEEFEFLLNAPPKRAQDYPSHYLFFRRLEPLKNVFRWIATRA